VIKKNKKQQQKKREKKKKKKKLVGSFSGPLVSLSGLFMLTLVL
jgi:hypothetical protein